MSDFIAFGAPASSLDSQPTTPTQTPALGNTATFGELTLQYSTSLADGWNTAGVSGGANGAFNNVQTPPTGGFLPLGSVAFVDNTTLSLGAALCLKPSGTTPTDSLPPLKHPIGFSQCWSTYGVRGGSNGALWVPIAPDGYVPLGNVFTGGNKPSVDTIYCVREDLTAPAPATVSVWNTGGVHGGDNLSLYASQLAEQTSYFGSKLLIPTNTFFVVKQVARVLQLPLNYALITPLLPPALTDLTTVPASPSTEEEDGYIDMPYTLISVLDANQNNTWKAQNSPFYRLTRYTSYSLLLYYSNSTDVDQPNTSQFTQGITEEKTKAYSHTTGITISAETGAAFLGTGGKITAAVNYQFNYTTSSAVTNMSSTAETVALTVPPKHAAALWGLSVRFIITRKNQTKDQGIASPLMVFANAYYNSQYPTSVATITAVKSDD